MKNKDKSVLCEFIFRYCTKYFLYGYICLLGGLILVGAGFFVFHLALPFKLISIFLWLLSIPVFWQMIWILITTKYKFRYYKISLYRLKTRGYKDEYFECEMHEPCIKLIIKDVLIRSGYKNEYVVLCKKCRGRNVRVEKAGERLLEQVKKRYES